MPFMSRFAAVPMRVSGREAPSRKLKAEREWSSKYIKPSPQRHRGTEKNEIGKNPRWWAHDATADVCFSYCLFSSVSLCLCGGFVLQPELVIRSLHSPLPIE